MQYCQKELLRIFKDHFFGLDDVWDRLNILKAYGLRPMVCLGNLLLMIYVEAIGKFYCN